MRQPTASFLLANPELVAPVAPWCATLDNLELGILLLAQPWLAGQGIRRAELERRLSHIARDLPVGPVYFQRVKRAVARLQGIGAVRGEGSGRALRFLVTPPGFAALILNLSVLRSDPTIDGSEFELKRALVAMWKLIFDRLSELPGDLPLDPELERFFDQVERLEVWGRQVITDELIGRALDVLRLIELQRRRVMELFERTEQRLHELRSGAEPLQDVDLSRLTHSIAPGVATAQVEDPATVAVMRTLAASALPAIHLQATVLRCACYLAYLDQLAGLYSRELRVVSFDVLRRLAGRARGS